MSEAELQAQCNAYLRTIGAHFIHLESGRGSKYLYASGIPDLLIYYKGKHILVELKTPTGKLKPSQVARFPLFKQAGFLVHIARSLDEFILIINRYFT